MAIDYKLAQASIYETLNIDEYDQPDGEHQMSGGHQADGDRRASGEACLSGDVPSYNCTTTNGESHPNVKSQPSHPLPPQTKVQIPDRPPQSPSSVTQSSSWEPPSSIWTPQAHPLVTEVTKTVEEYFLQTWHFPTPKARTRFLRAGFSRVTCLYFPKAKDERIESACKLLTVLFLIDGTEDLFPLPAYSVTV